LILTEKKMSAFVLVLAVAALLKLVLGLTFLRAWQRRRAQ